MLESSRPRNPDFVEVTDIVPLRRAPVFRDGHAPFRHHDLTDVTVLNDTQGFHDGNESRLAHQPRILASSHIRTSDAQDRVLPSIENPAPPQEPRRPGGDRLDGLSKRISGGLSIRSVTPQRLPRQEELHHDTGDYSYDHQFPKRRRVSYYEPVHGNSRSGIAPGVVESVVSDVLKDTGPRHVPYELAPSEHYTSRDDSHLRRKYAAPVDLPSAGRWPRRYRNSPVNTAYINPSSEFLDRTRVDCQGVYPAHSHPAEVFPGPSKESYALPSTSTHAVAVDDNSMRPMQVSSDSRPPPVYHGKHDYVRSRPLEIPQPQAPTWRNRDDERLVDISHRRNIYADDFVRPVGLYEPEPLEYTMQRPLVAETVSHSSRARIYDEKHRNGLVGTRVPVAYHDRRPWLDHRTAPSHGYATYEDPHRPLGDDRILEPSSVPDLYHKQRYEGSLDTARYGHSARVPLPQKTTGPGWVYFLYTSFFSPQSSFSNLAQL